ncbi:MAG: extra-cytoplasmic solute receptor protein [Polaromonas sp.]|nr:extra-cytoplasmic solute receptor protein [Polaromonas sp.]
MRQTVVARHLAICALAVALAPVAALAQGYPNKPIRILVHIPPGGAPDVAARVLGEKLLESTGQPVVIDNRAGANGNIAGEIVARSAPDGYTLMLCVDSQIVINPHVYGRMSFDPMKDLIPVATVASNEFFLAANPDQPFKTFREFIDYAKKSQPPLNYGSGGNGSQQQLTMEMLKARAGINLAHVPYKGAGPATVALLAGEIPVEFAGSNAGPQVRAGKLRALAIAGKKRLPAFPDVPTISEFYPGFSNSIWMGVCAPRGTPEPVLGKLRAEINKALAMPDVREKFARTGALEPLVTTPDEFAAMVKADYEKYGNVVKAVGVKLD